MRRIPGLDGYWADEQGHIYSDRTGNLVELKTRARDGYLLVTLKANGRRERHQVHRLVLMAFAGRPPEGAQCRHLNGNRADNRPVNLAWGTARENAADAIRHGTLGPGMRAHRRRLTLEQVQDIRARRRAGESKKKLALEYGIHPEYIPHLMQGRTWPEGAANGEGGGSKSSEPLAA